MGTENIEIFRALHGTLFLFGADAYGFQEPRDQMVCGYVFHIIRLKIDGSGETRFAAVGFTVSSQVGGLVTVRSTIPG